MSHPALAQRALAPRQVNWQPWRLAGGVLRYLFLGMFGFTMVVPFFWLFSSSLKTPLEAIAEPPVWIPQHPQWQSYLRVLTEIPMGRYYLNSLIVAGTVTLLAVINGALAGYALAKLKFRGKETVFRGILATLMLPSFLFLIPVYFMMRRVPLAGGNNIFGLGGSGLLHTHWSMILPFATSAFGIFLMRQFILTIPDDLLDAARIDGCSEFRIFW
ncbi:MAG: carbohydrate ABC transporter permease, partial [Deinococcus sp.]|nr:carbohydrate ABC transporter permease [Deinococcus sp.]